MCGGSTKIPPSRLFFPVNPAVPPFFTSKSRSRPNFQLVFNVHDVNITCLYTTDSSFFFVVWTMVSISPLSIANERLTRVLSAISAFLPFLVQISVKGKDCQRLFVTVFSLVLLFFFLLKGWLCSGRRVGALI